MCYQVVNLTRHKLLAERVVRTETFWSRLIGLIGRVELPEGEALHIEPCTSIHTFFMRIPIDALFLSDELKVIAICHVLPPWRISRIYHGARSVLELPAGVAATSGTRLGDILKFSPGVL